MIQISRVGYGKWLLYLRPATLLVFVGLIIASIAMGVTVGAFLAFMKYVQGFIDGEYRQLRSNQSTIIFLQQENEKLAYQIKTLGISCRGVMEEHPEKGIGGK